MSEEQICKEIIEQVGYQEFYRYFQEKTTLIEQQRKEIERLNNIINEFEKYCNEEIKDYDKALNSKVFVLTEKGKESYEAEKMCFLDMLDKLQELKKGEDKE